MRTVQADGNTEVRLVEAGPGIEKFTELRHVEETTMTDEDEIEQGLTIYEININKMSVEDVREEAGDTVAQAMESIL